MAVDKNAKELGTGSGWFDRLHSFGILGCPASQANPIRGRPGFPDRRVLCDVKCLEVKRNSKNADRRPQHVGKQASIFPGPTFAFPKPQAVSDQPTWKAVRSATFVSEVIRQGIGIWDHR